MKTGFICAVMCVAVVGLLGATNATAGERGGAGAARDPGVNRRQNFQAGRIRQGAKSGQLTREETKNLAQEQREIRKEEREYKSDGVLTREERKDLHQDNNEASKKIYLEKHDADTRGGVTPAEPRPLGTRDPGINARQEIQEARILQGIRSGELTWGEARRLVNRERFVARLERCLKEDGSLNLRERARLQQLLNELSADIYKEKHDARQR